MKMFINHSKTILENLELKSKLAFLQFSFQISFEIGNGSFGRVFQGFDTDHGLVIAVK